MEQKIFGFLLDERILFDVPNKKIIHYCFDDSQPSLFFRVVPLNETQARLLRFLLVNRKKEIIYRNDILNGVWDSFNLSSSGQKLWQSINEVRKKLSLLGLPDNFIMNIRGVGYCIENVKVTSLITY